MAKWHYEAKWSILNGVLTISENSHIVRVTIACCDHGRTEFHLGNIGLTLVTWSLGVERTRHTPHVQKGVLHHIFGIMKVAHDAVGERVGRPSIAVVQKDQRPFVCQGNSLEQGLVGWSFHNKMTGFPAQRLNSEDRGRIEEGLVADRVIFDPETVIDRATFEDPPQ